MLMLAHNGRWSEMSDHSGGWKVPKLETAVVEGLSSMSVIKLSSKEMGDDDATIM